MGGAHGCAPFSDRGRVRRRVLASHWLARRSNARAASAGRTLAAEPAKPSRKIPAYCHARCELRRGEPFLLVTFLWAQQRKVTRRKAEAVDLRSPTSNTQLLGTTAGTAATAATASALGGLLSLQGPKKVTKERPFPDGALAARTVLRGFSDSASCLGRKSTGIHAGRPSGLDTFLLVRIRDQQQAPQPKIHRSCNRNGKVDGDGNGKINVGSSGRLNHAHPRAYSLNWLHRNVKASALMCAACALLAEPPWPPSMFS